MDAAGVPAMNHMRFVSSLLLHTSESNIGRDSNAGTLVTVVNCAWRIAACLDRRCSTFFNVCAAVLNVTLGDDRAVGGSETIPPVPHQERLRYNQQFNAHDKMKAGFIAGVCVCVCCTRASVGTHVLKVACMLRGGGETNRQRRLVLRQSGQDDLYHGG